ncbi:MAG: AI-2E family transporter [Candidatus Edwardsbacteria bacterium]|nr:AI-2E family transporter [Candidatus Edwardsbacteria bacterium]
MKRTAKAPALLMLASFTIVVAGMKAASSLLVPLFLALFIAVICTPPLYWIRRKGVPKVLALAIILAVILIGGAFFVLLIGPSLNQFMSNLPGYLERLSANSAAFSSWLQDKGVKIPQDGAAGALNPGWVMSLAGEVFSTLSRIIANAILILLTVVFILLEVSELPQKMRAVYKNPETSLSVIAKFIKSAKRYLVIQTLISAAGGLLICLWLLILGVPYPLLWGTLAFILNFVPNIGSIFAAIPVILLALVQLGLGSALLTALGFMVVYMLLGNFLQPKLLGKGLSLSTLVVFLSMVFWGWILGPVGMLLSVPMTSLVKIFLESHEETRGLAVMLGSGTGIEQI